MMKSVFILVLVFISVQLTIAQEPGLYFPLKPKAEVNNSSCELNTAELDVLAQHTKPNEFILIISHLGKGEKNVLGKRRLHNAKTFLLKRPPTQYARSATSLLIAEGEQAEDKGRLDFYINGQIELRIILGKNRDLSVLPCAFNFPDEKSCQTEFERLFYPCKSKK